jgi:hypothetical protein
MGRTIGAVAAGAAVWAVLWIGGNGGLAAAFPEIIVPGRRLDHLPMLLGLIGYSVALSVLAGFVTAAVRGRDAMGAVRILAGLQLALGILAEALYWSTLPVWYHLVFLALIVPATLWGGHLRSGRGSRMTGVGAV